MLLKRVNNKIKTKWYQKPTASGRVLNFNSHHPYNMKKNVADSLYRRALRLSEPEHKILILKTINKILENNN